MEQLIKLLKKEGLNITKKEDEKITAEKDNIILTFFKTRGGNLFIRGKKNTWKGKGVFLQLLFNEENFHKILEMLNSQKSYDELKQEIEKMYQNKYYKIQKHKQKSSVKSNKKLIVEEEKIEGDNLFIIRHQDSSIDSPLALIQKKYDKTIIIFYDKRAKSFNVEKELIRKINKLLLS